MKEQTIFDRIRQWAEERGLYEKGDVKSQCLKLQEEVGELSRAILKNDSENIVDSIGDCVVVLTNLARIHAIKIREECKVCHGQGYFDEDVVGDGGSRMRMACEECAEEAWDIEYCLEQAYDQIKNRKGAMSNGTFVKE